MTEVMRKEARDEQNHGVEESWRKLKRSHRWWVRWTRLFRSGGGPTLISARHASLPIFAVFVLERLCVESETVCHASMGERRKKEQRRITCPRRSSIRRVMRWEDALVRSSPRWGDGKTEDGLLSATFHLAEKFSNWASNLELG